MTVGLQKTFHILSKTRNEAALPWLIAALEAEQESLRLDATRAILERRSPAGHRELLQRWRTLSESQLQIVTQHATRLSGAVRDGILGTDAELNHNACDAVVRLRHYDLIPTLVKAAEDKANAYAEQAAHAAVTLADHLHTEFSAPRDYRIRRDPAMVRQFVYGSLEQSVRHFSEHRRGTLVEAFLLLIEKDDSLLTQVLSDPSDPAFAAVTNQLTTSTRPGVMRVILYLLEEPHAPTAILHVVARRRDEPFLHYLLCHGHEGLTANFKSNVHRVDSWAWLRDDTSILSTFNDNKLCGAVRVVTASKINRLQAFEVVKFALQRGGVRSRRAATMALAEFKGGDANELVLLAIADRDPEVQAHAVVQLRERGIPGAMQRLVDLLDSPHEVVRTAVHSALAEFTFPRFLSAFEMLDRATRQVTGTLVKRLDPDAIGHLQMELTSLSRSRKCAGLEIATAMQATREVEEEILTLSADPDHFVRSASAQALAHVNSERSQKRLEELKIDRAISVQEAASEALEQFISVPDPFASNPKLQRPPMPLVPDGTVLMPNVSAESLP